MATVTLPNTLTPGTPEDVTKLMANLNALKDGVNTIDTAQIASGAVTAAKLASAVGNFGAWTSYTPIWTGSSTNPAIGDGTLNGHYCQIGKHVTTRIALEIGSTTTFGSGYWSFDMPVSAVDYGVTTIGTAYVLDSGAAEFLGFVTHGGSTVQMRCGRPASATTLTNATLVDKDWPMTWAAGDKLNVQFAYQAS